MFTPIRNERNEKQFKTSNETEGYSSKKLSLIVITYVLSAIGHKSFECMKKLTLINQR